MSGYRRGNKVRGGLEWGLVTLGNEVERLSRQRKNNADMVITKQLRFTKRGMQASSAVDREEPSGGFIRQHRTFLAPSVLTGKERDPGLK